MKKLFSAILALALCCLLFSAAAAEKAENWVVQSNGRYSLLYPEHMVVFSSLEEDYGWNMDILLDLEATDETGTTVSLTIIFAGAADWAGWLETGAFPDDRGITETMDRVPAENPPVSPDTGMEMTYALFRSGDGLRSEEAFILEDPEGSTDYVLVCRYPAGDDGLYSDVLHRMVASLTFLDPSGLSGTRGSFSVKGTWEYDGFHEVIRDVVLDRDTVSMYWVFVESDVKNFRIEKLTWNDRTFKVTKAKKLYSKKKLTTKDVIAVHGWLPEILPTARIRGVNADGVEEIWYISTNEENGSIILLSEEEMQYVPR